MLTHRQLINGLGNANPSSYQPTGKEKDRILQVIKDFEDGDAMRHESYAEFNDRSLIDYINDCQTAFNTYIPAKTMNPDEQWRTNTVRPLTRNKVISIASHLTSNVLYPNIFSQNDKDEEDRSAAIVMKDLMEWTMNQSDYDMFFVSAVISACVNPAVCLYEGYAEVKRTIKEIQEDGKWIEKDIVDEDFSGFINENVPVAEIILGNFHINNIQQQPFVIWQRFIDYNTAVLKYRDYDNFKYVKPGIRCLYTESTDLFYDQKDKDIEYNLVEELIYYNKLEDLEIVILNGVLITDADRPMQRKDKRYPFVWSGYEFLDDGKFSYFKSLVDKMAPDQYIINTLYRMIIDGTYLSLMPPAVVYGGEEIDSNVIIPGSVTTFSKSDTKMEMLKVGTNLNEGFQALQYVEGSAAESSQDPLMQGQQQKGSQTAFEIARQEANAKTVLGLFGKMIGNMVKQFGELRMSTILQYMTIADASQLQSPASMLKFRNFLIPEKIVDGSKVTKKVEFSMDVPDEEIEEEKYEDKEWKLLDRELEGENGEELEGGKRIYMVNPKMFRELKYKVVVSPDFATPKSDALKKALNLEAYDRAISNPLANQEAVFRDFLIENYKPGEADKYIKKQEEQQPMPGMEGMDMPQAKQPGKDVISQIGGKKSMGVAQAEGLAGPM